MEFSFLIKVTKTAILFIIISNIFIKNDFISNAEVKMCYDLYFIGKVVIH